MGSIFKEKLEIFRQLFFREKYRFDQGNAFLVFINFSMLVASLVKQSHGNPSMVMWYVLIGLAGTWFLGYFLDKFVRVQDASERVVFKRSPIWKENFNHHGQIQKKIGKLEKKLDNIQELLNEIKEIGK